MDPAGAQPEVAGAAPAALQSREGSGPARGEPGRAAIDRALDALYPDTRDHRMGMMRGPGEDAPPLEEIVAYRASTPEPHWHYVTYGLSELAEKTSDNAELSGWGIELSLRLVDDSPTPPIWPMNYLRWLAQGIWRDSTPYGALHSVPLPRNMLGEVSSGTEGSAFIVDPQLGEVQTSNGNVTFLQVLPVTADEFVLLGQWDANAVFEEMRKQDGALLWRNGRRSILQGPHGEEIRRRSLAEGSSQQLDFTSELAWDEKAIHLDALNRRVLLKFLRYRLAYGRPARAVSEDHVLFLEPGEFGLRRDGKDLHLSIPQGPCARACGCTGACGIR